MHGVSAHTGFPRTLTKTIYISAIFSTLNPILSVANLSRLECAETQFARKPSLRGNPVHTSSSRIDNERFSIPEGFVHSTHIASLSPMGRPNRCHKNV